MKVLITGGAGFIGSYVTEELLDSGHEVVCLDNFSKYGRITRGYFSNPKFTLIVGDATDTDMVFTASAGCDYIIAGAAMIGGISYFHKYAYDLLATNERILASTFDAAIKRYQEETLKKIVVISSSMVFERTDTYPSKETDILRIPSPESTYGFQKLACEYFAKGAHEQYGLPYTIVRPFNCVGVGEQKALSEEIIPSGNISLALSHVLPDLAQKMVRGQRPLRILGDGSQIRCYTHGSDIARAMRICLDHPNALNEDFNISTARSTTVTELASLVWRHFEKGEPKFEHDEPFVYDVQKRIPDVTKAKIELGFEAKVSLEESVTEVCDWVSHAIKEGMF
ncbi:MAG: NAD(P)-dependent oxidoreductase [Desulfuromonadaceae bacterium]|nr:NAD(P)-dependent oxidoreductase [Desulfuromonadaceae bacterium]MDD2854569.1 NAD(P)-dependent oxidoreductase [Desulfuromonadaceae bacterium]